MNDGKQKPRADQRLQILTCFDPNPGQSGVNRRAWAPKPLATSPKIWQFDVNLPIGKHMALFEGMKQYLQDELGIAFGSSVNDPKPGVCFGKNIMTEEQMRDIGFTYVPYQFLFHEDDMNKLNAHVAERINERVIAKPITKILQGRTRNENNTGRE